MKKFKFNIEEDMSSVKREIIDTYHAIERYLQRWSNIYSHAKINSVITKVSDEIIKKYGDKSGEYGFHSRSTKLGGIILWQRYGDKRKDTGYNNAVIKTLFPPKSMHNFKNVDAQILVEKHILYTLWKEHGYNPKDKKHLKEGLGEVYKIDECSFTIYEGEVYDSHFDGYVVVN